MVNWKLKGLVPCLANLFNKVYKGKDKMLSKVDQMAMRITFFSSTALGTVKRSTIYSLMK